MLFLCTGNYYRSRFAEVFFNHLAPQHGLPWRAESRGLRPSAGNVGPISQHTLAALKKLNVDPGELRLPLLVTQADFDRVQHVVAVKEAEHRLLMNELFPHLTDKIEYWHVHDLDCSGPDDTICHLQREVLDLIGRLKELRGEIG